MWPSSNPLQALISHFCTLKTATSLPSVPLLPLTLLVTHLCWKGKKGEPNNCSVILVPPHLWGVPFTEFHFSSLMQAGNNLSALPACTAHELFRHGSVCLNHCCPVPCCLCRLLMCFSVPDTGSAVCDPAVLPPCLLGYVVHCRCPYSQTHLAATIPSLIWPS